MLDIQHFRLDEAVSARQERTVSSSGLETFPTLTQSQTKTDSEAVILGVCVPEYIYLDLQCDNCDAQWL